MTNPNLGSIIAGTTRDVFATGAETKWRAALLPPCALALLCAAALLLFFRGKSAPVPAATGAVA